MAKAIRRAGVIGAGVMGSGIAAHFANAGLDVLLLDMVPPGLSDAEKNDRTARSRFAISGLEKAVKSRPAAFFHPSLASRVKTGNTEDDFDKLKDCDLVIEAVFERMDIKQALLTRLENTLGPDTIVASNTSGLSIEKMLEGRSEGFRKRFLVMHFFNPVRYMKLLELVPGVDTDPALFAHVARFGENVLGKGIVVAKDTPNFVGNRIGAYAMMKAIHQMLADGLAPEDVDALTGTPMAHPKSASFRTADLVGLDTFVHVAQNCYDSLLQDEERDVFVVPAYIHGMVEKKYLGNKTKGGFYRKGKEGVMTLDPATLEYRAKGGDEEILKIAKKIAKEENAGERIRKVVAAPGKAGAFSWKVMSSVLAYSARRLGEICESVQSIDDAMRWGYNWELGPFEAWDALGFAATVDRMVTDGVALPASILAMREKGVSSFYREDGAVYDVAKGEYVMKAADPRNATLKSMRKGDAPVLANDGAEAWDLGDGVLGVTFKTKVNSIDPDVISMLWQVADKAEQEYKAVLLFNEGEHFCLGANLGLVCGAAASEEWDGILQMVKGFQGALQRLKYAQVPFVVAPFGMTLGGGLELCLAADAVQAAAETYAGLVEVGVGLIPGGAGNLNMLWRALEGIPEGTTSNITDYVVQVFKNIALAKVATSAYEAKQFGYFRKSDGISFDRARHLAEAKALALGLANAGYHPPAPRSYRLLGESGIATLKMMVETLMAGGYASEHDGKIALELANVLCGGKGGSAREVTEQELLDIEADAFLRLCREEKSRDRMLHMVMNNKPLRN